MSHDIELLTATPDYQTCPNGATLSHQSGRVLCRALKPGLCEEKQ